VNVNELLGFEVGDLKTGKMLHRVEIAGFEKGPVKRHGCPSHGIGLTPDEKELWVTTRTIAACISLPIQRRRQSKSRASNYATNRAGSLQPRWPVRLSFHGRRGRSENAQGYHRPD